jgi:hypothetical protein
MTVRAAILVFALAAPACALGTGLKSQAEEAYSSSRRTDAARTYCALSDAEPQPGTYGMRLGSCLHDIAIHPRGSAARKKKATSGVL